MKNLFLVMALGLVSAITLSGCSSVSMPSLPGSVSSSQHTSIFRENKNSHWHELQRSSSAKLMQLQNTTTDPTEIAWIQLALINKRYSTNTQQSIQELIAWREKYPSHPGNQLFPDTKTLHSLMAQPGSNHIALLLPLHGTYASSGQAVRDGFLNAYYAKLSSGNKQTVSFYDTAGPKSMTALYQQAVSEGAVTVVGPLLKENVKQLLQRGSFPIPTLALNYTDIYFGSLPTNFYQFGLLPEDEASVMADRAAQAGLSKAIIIAPNTPWGNRMRSALSSQWQSLGGHVQETMSYGARANFNQDIAKLLRINAQADKQLMKRDNNKHILEQQRRHDFDVIFIFAKPEAARVIVPLLKYYYVNDVPMYASSSVYSGKPNPEKDMDLNGVTVCDIPHNLQRAQAEGQGNRLYAVGQDAYLLSQTLPRLASMPNFSIYGATGSLTLSSKQQIHRRVPCVRFNHGRL